MKLFIGDLEANGFLEEANQLWCGSFISLDGKERYSFSPLDGEDYAKRMLEFMDSCEALCFHNGFGYDFPLLKKLFNYEYKGIKLDTLVMSRLFKPKRPVPPHCPIKNKPHSVETWGYRVGRGKVEHNDWSQFSVGMLHRNKEDAEIQRLIYLALLEEEKQYNWTSAVKLSHRLFEDLADQESYGWLVDKEQILKGISLLDHWMSRIDRVLTHTLPYTCEIGEGFEDGEYKYVKTPFVRSGAYHYHTANWIEKVGWKVEDKPVWGPFSRVNFRRLSIDKDAEIKDYLLELGWIPLQWNTNKETGERTSPKLDKDDPFEGIEGGPGKLIAKYKQAKSRRSIMSGWLELIRPDGRIPSSVANLAETGRATHRNIVNVPNAEAFFGKIMRKCFTSKEGWVLVGTDSKGCQNRMLAARVGDEFFTNTLVNGKKEDGTSIHHVNQKAIRIAGYEVTYGKAKNLNYAFMFGASNKKLGKMVGGSPDDGQRVREALLGVSAGFTLLVENLVKEWRSNAKTRRNKWNRIEYYGGWVTGLDGRPIFIESEHAILVYVLQSDEAIMMSCAYIWMCKELRALYTYGVDYGVVCWYHDEYTVECRAEIAEEVARISEECIARAGRYFKIACPHEGDASIGKNWYDIH